MMTNRSFCGGLVGPGATFFTLGGKWDKTDLTWSMGNTPPEFRAAMREAFQAWDDVCGLSFERWDDETADIRLKWARGDHGDGYPFDGRGNVLEHAFMPGPGLGGDVHFDLDEEWSTNPPTLDVRDAKTIAKHGIGHGIGITHSSVSGALMFPFYFGPLDLQADDIAAAQALYGVSGGVGPSPDQCDVNSPLNRRHHQQMIPPMLLIVQQLTLDGVAAPIGTKLDAYDEMVSEESTGVVACASWKEGGVALGVHSAIAPLVSVGVANYEPEISLDVRDGTAALYNFELRSRTGDPTPPPPTRRIHVEGFLNVQDA